MRETKAIYCSSFQTCSNGEGTDGFGGTGAKAPSPSIPELGKEHIGFPNIKEKLALELNNCRLGGSRRDVSGDKMSFQSSPVFVRASIRELQRDPITAGHLCALSCVLEASGNGNKTHPLSLSLTAKTANASL